MTVSVCPTCGSKFVFAHLPGEAKYQKLCDRLFRATVLKHMTGERSPGEIVTHEEASTFLGQPDPN